MTVPNVLSIARIALAPVFAATYISGGGPTGDPFLLRLSVAIFVIAFALDVLDGLLARAFNQTSGLGVFLDPFADKLLIATALLVIVLYDSVPLWIVGVVLGRDVVICGGWLVLRRYGLAPQIRPSRVGRTALTFQVIAIVATMIALPGSIRWAFWIAALSLTLIAGVSYAYRGLQPLLGRSRDGSSSRDSQVA